MICPERTTNLVRGKGFHDNDYVLQKFVDAGKYQEALDYFGFEGRYKNEDGVSSYNRRSDKIVFRNDCFNSYSELLALYMKEYFHMRRFKSGEQILGNSGYFGVDRWPEEREGTIRQYKTRGIHKYAMNYINAIKFSENQIYLCNKYGDYYPTIHYNVFAEHWWHIAYKIPKLW